MPAPRRADLCSLQALHPREPRFEESSPGVMAVIACTACRSASAPGPLVSTLPSLPVTQLVPKCWCALSGVAAACSSCLRHILCV